MGKYYAHHLGCSEIEVSCSTELRKIDGFNSLSESEKKEVIDKLLPYQVAKHLRPRLNIIKDVDELNLDEILHEMEKRDICSYIELEDDDDDDDDDDLIKNKMLKRLIEYLSGDECKQSTDKLVRGYCKDIENKNRMNIPSYIQHIVFKYYPTVLFANYDKKSLIMNINDTVPH